MKFLSLYPALISYYKMMKPQSENWVPYLWKTSFFYDNAPFGSQHKIKLKFSL